jgi:hypothetical protein
VQHQQFYQLHCKHWKVGQDTVELKHPGVQFQYLPHVFPAAANSTAAPNLEDADLRRGGSLASQWRLHGFTFLRNNDDLTTAVAAAATKAVSTRRRKMTIDCTLAASAGR